ncbi:MAG: endo-1,3-alpha-glucanase family glycosylhydrolase [Phototrophicaceae bacterium]|jgi:hypothetical protein
MKKLLGMLMLVMLFSIMAVSGVSAQTDRQVWAYYMGFWFGPGSWDSSASLLTDRPSRGSYDARDGGTVGGQIDEARSAGIDAFIVNWRGFPEETQAVYTILDQAAARGFKAGVSIDVFGGGNRDSVVNNLRAAYGFLGHPAYLTYGGKPIIFFAFQNRAGLSASEWVAIRNEIDPSRSATWIAEGLSGCCVYSGAMDGMYAFNLAWSNGAAGRMSSEAAAVRRAGGSLYIPTIHPGWNEQLVAAAENRGNPTAPKDRAGGAFLRNNFNNAASTGANVILVVSWNEFIENSHIEPSTTYGTQSLDTLRPLIAAWEGNAPPPAPAVDAAAGSAPAAPAAAPTGVTILLGYNANVRNAPSSSGAVLGQVGFGTLLEVSGRSGDNAWVQVNYNGQAGWVSLSLGQLSTTLESLPILQ